MKLSGKAVLALAFLWSSCATFDRLKDTCLSPAHPCKPGEQCIATDDGSILACVAIPPSPTPPPTTTTMPAPSPTPTPTPLPTPTPTPDPTPTPTPTPKPTPPPVCKTTCSPDVWRCKDWLDNEISHGHKHKGAPDAPYYAYGCLSTGAPEVPGCKGMNCHNLKCEPVDCVTGRPLGPVVEWVCDPKVIPCPSPTPMPVPTPIPTPGGCPPLLEMGGSMLAPRSCSPGCVKDGYLGYVVNWTATPLISAESGQCAPGRNRCEMPKTCQDPRGAYTWLYLPGVFPLSICDERSDNPFNCHHKPKKNEAGRTYFISCPWGVEPPVPPAIDPRCTLHVVDVRQDRPVEIK